MTNRLTLDSSSWWFDPSGKMHFKQQQLFHLHRLSLMIIRLTGRRLRFRTLNELEEFLAFAETIQAEQVQSQLESVRSVLAFHWIEPPLTD